MNGIQENQKSGVVQNVNHIIGIQHQKRCPRCKQIKIADNNNFQKNKSTSDGLSTYCKKCASEYKAENSDKIKITARNWRQNNKEYTKQYNKFYFPIKLEKDKQWRINNPQKAKERDKRKYKNRKMTIKKRISANMGTLIRYYIKKGNKHWELLVGYTVHSLMIHLESLFTEGMSWDNYGKKGWEIDHKIPVSYFNFNSYYDDSFKKCWSLSNLQPLWGSENRHKSAKIKEEFKHLL